MDNRRCGFTLIELLGVGVLLSLISGVVGGWVWPYSINTWLEWADKGPAVGWWAGFGIGCIPVVGWVGFLVALATWVGTLFV